MELGLSCTNPSMCEYWEIVAKGCCQHGLPQLFLIYQLNLKFCTEHGSISVVLWATFQNDFTTEMDVMNEQNFVRLHFQDIDG